MVRRAGLFLLIFLVLMVSFAHAKVIVVGSHGGPWGFINPFNRDAYEPFSSHAGRSSDWVGEISNHEDGAHGVDASILYLKEETSSAIYAMISEDTANFLTAYYFVKNNYVSGDKVFLVGFSSGGSFVVTLSQMLALANCPVHVLGLFDPVINSVNHVYVPSNVQKVALYYQESYVIFQLLVLSDSTSFFSGHPKLILEDGITHFSLPFYQSVWKDFGEKMVDFVDEENHTTNSDGAIVFTEGAHTHIIHPDYRCSNDQCWEPGGETNCWDAQVWYEIIDGNVHGSRTYRDRSMCEEVYTPTNDEGGYGYPGPGTSTDPTDSANPDCDTDPCPDFIVDEVVLKDGSGNEKYSFTSGETMRVHSYSENIGDADWAGDRDDIYVMFLLSNGYKEDSHSDWVEVGKEQIQEGNLDVGDRKHEHIEMSLEGFSPGVYNIVVCVDRKYTKNNGDGEVPEIHKSNNCSTEAVFIVTSAPNNGLTDEQVKAALFIIFD